MNDQVTLDQLSVNTIRTLSMDAIQQANSGHPGTPMALAPVAYCLWQRFLRFDPEDPIWPNRDRFVLSNGHASTKQFFSLPPGQDHKRIRCCTVDLERRGPEYLAPVFGK